MPPILMLTTAPPRIHRSLEELKDYAERLHTVDPKCKEEIGITPEEAFALQEHVMSTNGKPFSVFDMQLSGHKLRIL